MTPPPIDWFRSPGLTEPTPVTISPEGRVYGHVATFDQSHVGLPGRHVKPPRSTTNYGEFHRRPGCEVIGDDGAPTTIATGVLTYDTSHAPINATTTQSDRHFDHSGSIAAKVCAGEDDVGIWVSGQLDPSMDESKRWRITACALSGEWRPDDRRPPSYPDIEMRHALFVPFEGFPIMRGERALAASGERQEGYALVAAGALIPRDVDPADIRIVISTSTPPEEATPMPKTDDPTADAEPVTAAAPPFAKGEPSPGPDLTEDSIVQLTADPPPGVVRSIDGDTAVVEIEVPVSSLAAAEDGAKQAMAASAQRKAERREYEKDKAATSEEIGGLRTELATLTASLRHRDDQAAFEKAPAGLVSPGNG